MIEMTCPNDDPKALYEDLATHTRDAQLRAALLAESGRVARRSGEYLRLAEEGQLFTMEQEAPVGLTRDELSGVYERVLVKGSGRNVYDRILSSAKFRRCPLCGHRVVKTLDHYLPQTRFPELAVFPANLVPACADCNKAKLAHVAATREEETYHPYFDDWSGQPFLGASLEFGERLTVSFSVVNVPEMTEQDLCRIRNHMELLQLNELYVSHASVELAENKETYRRNFSSGADVLREELRQIAETRSRANRNSWIAALYRCLAESNEFCDGGFELIEE
ncbi:HNH endonuclease [Burkholderia glumae]